MCQLLDPAQPVLGGVEARLAQPQSERREREHIPTPGDRLLLEMLEGDDRVHQAHRQRFLRGVLAAQEPELLGLLGSYEVRQQARPEAAVERSNARADLAEAGIVGGDREVADQVQHVAAADRVARDHRHHRLRQAPDLDVEVGDVEASRAPARHLLLLEIARVAAHALVAPEQNASGPAPVSTTTPIAGSSRASSRARESSMTVRGRNAFRTSGRSIVTFAMPQSSRGELLVPDVGRLLVVEQRRCPDGAHRAKG